MSGSVTGSDCEWSGCREPGTHQVHVEHSDGRNEDLRLCRDHDDAIKAKVRQAVGPKPKEPSPTALPAAVACGQCGRVLDEPQGLPVDQRQPCADCGSTKRQVRVTLEGRLDTHGSLTALGTHAGQPKGSGSSVPCQVIATTAITTRGVNGFWTSTGRQIPIVRL